MPFIGHTPEALLGRSDSKNPATTCKGITSSGRPCRRAIASTKKPGVLAVVSVGDGDEEGAGAFFCWQHKDQAEQLAAQNSPLGRVEEETHIVPLQQRSSIDTLVQRLGVLEVRDESPSSGKSKKDRKSSKPPGAAGSGKKIGRPPTWGSVQGPLMSVPSDLMASTSQNRPPRPSSSAPKKHGLRGLLYSLCCGSADDDYMEVIRHKQRINGQSGNVSQTPAGISLNGRPPRPSTDGRPQPSIVQTPPRVNAGRKPLDEKELIPKTLPPQTASALAAEVKKPISPHDEEGYIYIFWLTDEKVAPPRRAASTLLAPEPQGTRGRSVSDVLMEHSWRALDDTRSRGINSSGSTEQKKTILLKIGRASNVHRRMNEWTRQCGYELSLVRFYPYVSSTSPTPSPAHTPPASRRPSSNSAPQRPSMPASPAGSDTVRKVPHAHRVERLIHIELGEKRVKRNCDACGKEHREWFEVEASRAGIQEIDEVIKKWVAWAESN